jgi:hypothetical protein
MIITGTTVFVPVDITEDDCAVIFRDLAVSLPTEPEWDTALRNLAITSPQWHMIGPRDAMYTASQ